MRVIASVYTGSTEKRALDELVGLGAKVKVSYETSQTRLHAKAWLFERDSGFHTAYVGSSNLTQSALLDGLEWNVRATPGRQPGDHRADPRDVRAVLERARVRDLRPASRRRAAPGGARRPERAPGAIADAVPTEHRCRAQAVPGRDARGARSRAPARALPQPRRRTDRHRQDVGVRVRLRATPERRATNGCCSSPTATRSSSRARRSSGSCSMIRCSASDSSPASGRCIGTHVFASIQSLHRVDRATRPDAVRRRDRRRVPPRRGGHLPATPRAPASRRSCSV